MPTRFVTIQNKVYQFDYDYKNTDFRREALNRTQKPETAAIFEENQRIRMFLELRELQSSGAIRGHYKVYKRHIWILTQNVLEPKKGMVDT